RPIRCCDLGSLVRSSWNIYSFFQSCSPTRPFFGWWSLSFTTCFSSHSILAPLATRLEVCNPGRDCRDPCHLCAVRRIAIAGRLVDWLDECVQERFLGMPNPGYFNLGHQFAVWLLDP